MLRRLRSSIVAAFLAAWVVLPALWAAWGIGGVLSIATLAWILWPTEERPRVPSRLPTAAELTRSDPARATTAPAATRPAEPPAWLILGPPNPGTTTAPVPGEKEVFRATFFEPGAEGLDPRYSHQVELTQSQVRDVIGRMEVLEKKVTDLGHAQREYAELDAWVTQGDVEQGIYDRIRSGRGFIYPDLPEVWARYTDNGGLDLGFELLAQQAYFSQRLRNIRSAVVRGRVTEGDMKFLDHAIAYVDEQAARVAERHANAKQLEKYLGAELLLLGENPRIRARRREQEQFIRSFGIEPRPAEAEERR